VQVDGVVIRRPSQRLTGPGGATPRCLVLHVDPAEVEVPLSLEGRVLFEDEHLLAVDKPSGYPVVAKLARAGEDVVGAARLRFGDVWPVHRLDTGTSGVLLLARSAVAARTLSEAFASRRVTKTYVAWVATRPNPARGVIDAPILAPGDGTLPRLDPAGSPARTRYRTLGPDGPAWRVLLRPHSGRTHQLRLHMAFLEAPLLGDPVYGEEAADRLWLHAWALRFPHPQSGAMTRVTACVPSCSAAWGACTDSGC
jgi:RluA family pseudouridine synthase